MLSTIWGPTSNRTCLFASLTNLKLSRALLSEFHRLLVNSEEESILFRSDYPADTELADRCSLSYRRIEDAKRVVSAAVPVCMLNCLVALAGHRYEADKSRL